MGSVFISHASEDKARLTPVLEGLLRRDVTLFVDHPELVNWSADVRPRVKDMVRAIGKGRWRPIINDALEACDIVAGAVSAGAMRPRSDVPDQRVVKDEFDIAMGLAKFVPFKIDAQVDINQDRFMALHNMRYFDLARRQDADACIDWICAARKDVLERSKSGRFQFWADRRTQSCKRYQNGAEQTSVTLNGESFRLNYVPAPDDSGAGYYISKWTAGPQSASLVEGILRDIGAYGVDVPTYAELRHAFWPEGCLNTEGNPFGLVRDAEDVTHWVLDDGRLTVVDVHGKPVRPGHGAAFLRLKF